MRMLLLFIIMAVPLFGGCRFESEATTSSPSGTDGAVNATPKRRPVEEWGVESPGIHEIQTELADGTTYRIALSIPQGYSKSEPRPLIVALHYGGYVTPFYGRGMFDGFVDSALEELGAIMVAPDSIAGPWTNPKNEQAVLELIDRLSESYAVDKERIILTGYSMGGRGTWFLAGRHQDRFSAAIPIAGAPSGDVEWKIPLYVIHSRQDEVLPLAPTEKYVTMLKSKGVNVTLVVIDDVTHYEADRFAKPLRDAVPWIKRTWESRSAAQPSTD